jgi:hypothetical protein
MSGVCAVRVSHYTITRFPSYQMVLVAAGVSLAGDEHGRLFLLGARSERVQNPIHDPACCQDAESQRSQDRREENQSRHERVQVGPALKSYSIFLPELRAKTRPNLAAAFLTLPRVDGGRY